MYPDAITWVTCARCMTEIFVETGTVSVYPDLPGDGPRVLCTRCKHCQETGTRGYVRGARCVHVDYPRGPFSERLVLETDGDRVHVMTLGYPDGVPESAHVFHPSVSRTWFNRYELILM